MRGLSVRAHHRPPARPVAYHDPHRQGGQARPARAAPVRRAAPGRRRPPGRPRGPYRGDCQPLRDGAGAGAAVRRDQAGGGVCADALGPHGYAPRRRRARQQRHQPARRSPFQGARLQIHRGRRPAGGGGAAARVRGGGRAGGAGVRARISHAQPGRSDPGAQRRARAVLQPRAAGRVPGRQAALAGAAVDHGRGARRAGSGPASWRSGDRHRPRPQVRAGRLRAGVPLRPAGAGHRQPRPPPARPAGGTGGRGDPAQPGGRARGDGAGERRLAGADRRRRAARAGARRRPGRAGGGDHRAAEPDPCCSAGSSTPPAARCCATP